MPTTRHKVVVVQVLFAGVKRFDTSLSPSWTIQQLRGRTYTITDFVYLFQIAWAVFWLLIIQNQEAPYRVLFKFAIPITYTIGLLVPFTSQFLVPATPIFLYLLTFSSMQFLPPAWQPDPPPTLSMPLLFASFTHPLLIFILWLFRSKRAAQFQARLVGYTNLATLFILLIFPPTTLLPHAVLGLKSSSFNYRDVSTGLNTGLQMFAVAYFFPQVKWIAFLYLNMVLCSAFAWAEPELNLLGFILGACLAASFYFVLPDELRGNGALAPPGGMSPVSSISVSSENVDMEKKDVPSVSADSPAPPIVTFKEKRAIPPPAPSPRGPRRKSNAPLLEVPSRPSPPRLSIPPKEVTRTPHPLLALPPPRPSLPTNEYENPQRFSDKSFDELALLGRSSTRALHKVRDKRSGVIYALKTITPREMSPRHIINELTIFMTATSSARDAEGSRNLNVVRCFGTYVGGREGDVKVVLEYCEGGSLQSVGEVIAQRGGVVGEKVIGKLAEGILHGLVFIHDLKIVHRDIKPSNVLLSREGIVKLSEPVVTGELAKAFGETFLTSLTYTAPERIVQSEAITGRSDIWSMGITLLEFMQNRCPFPSELSPVELMLCITQQEPPKLEDEGCITWSSEMKDFFRQLLIVDSGKRPDTTELMKHPWIVNVLKQEIRMEKWMSQVWGWPKNQSLVAR